MFSFLNSALPILTPVLCTVALEMIFLHAIKRRDGKIEFSEVGVVFSGLISIYAVLPAVTFFAGGMEYSLLSDVRLFRAQPSPADLAPIFWFYFLYLASFAWAYSNFRGNAPLRKPEIPKPSPQLIWILLCGYLSIRLFFIVIRTIWNIQAPETYGDEYLLYQNLPLFLQQLANHLGWMSLTTELLLMAALTLNYKKYRVFIFGWLAAEFLAIAIFSVGSRTGLMMALLTFAITYHLFVKKLGPRTVGLLSFAALLLFMVLGFARMISADGSVQADATLLASSNEFEALFANAYDIRQLKAADETSDIFPGLYFSDMANLIPQQLLPFKKVDLGQWYAQTFYSDYADTGGGFAFGAIPESIVGLGWIDLIWRGLLVGWAFAYIYRRFVTGANSFWEYAFYLWVTIFCYQAFRTTTFILVPHAIYDVLTVMLIAKLASRFVTWVLKPPASTARASKLAPEAP